MTEEKQKKLSKKQIAVIQDLLEADMDESQVIAKHNISTAIYRKWLADKTFAGELNFRIESAKRHSRLIIARYAPVAAVKLVKLTECEKEETARKACLDIISLPAAEDKLNQTETDPTCQPIETLSPETAGKLLEFLADETL